MVVASGQMPYNYGTALPLRALPFSWPGVVTPNIAASGDIIEAAMFVYNAELRKWNFTGTLDQLYYNLYTHPNITPSGFEPKARGDTLVGLVTGSAGLLSVDNIEQMRTQLRTFLFEFYEDDSDYETEDFMQAWLETAYPESPSGSLVIHQISPPTPAFALDGRTFLRPSAEHITGGDFIDINIHWLGGSGVLFAIDCGEVVFNPFPFLHISQYVAPSTGNHRVNFGPIMPVIQTTAGTLPSVDAARYQTDLSTGSFKSSINFEAIASGYVQIDGYVLLAGTTIELVHGNDRNVEGTVTSVNDYTGHIQGLRRLRLNTGMNDPSARCYRLPSAQASGLYRLLAHNRKADVPTTAIPSGFVSIWPQGQVTLTKNTGLQGVQSNFIDGQQLTEASDGTMILSPLDAKGVHVLDDAIWITSPNDSDGSGTFHSPGLFVLSPHNGDLVWYRPAERILSTSGNFGPGPAIFGAHIGLMDLGSDFVRVSRTCLQIQETNVLGNEDRLTETIYFQRYDKTTLDHIEFPVGYAIQSEDATLAAFAGLTGLHGAMTDGTNIYIWTNNGSVHKFTSSLAFDTAYRGPIARRRHYANGQLLYTVGDGITAGDPLLSIIGGISSGIGVWSTTDPAGTSVDMVGVITHNSAKPLRGETHFGLQIDGNALIHQIFEVTGSTHVRNGTWILIQFVTNLYLARIIERASDWLVVESIKFRDTFEAVSGGGSMPDEFPIEGIRHDID